MGNKGRLAFVWRINISSSQQLKEYYCSDTLLIDGCKWRLILTPMGNKFVFSYHYLGVADHKSLPSRWTSNVNLCFTLVNRRSKNCSLVKDSELCVNEKSPTCRYRIGFMRSSHLEEHGGFLKVGRLKIVLKIGSVKRKIEKHHGIASEILLTNWRRTTYLNAVLGQIKTLCQFPGTISDDDLEEASSVVSNAAKGGLVVDWLEKRLEEVKEKKKVATAKARLQQIDEELLKLIQKLG
ncbi:PREDICTED: MATH domain and coiled-coil domain-containing protein At3g58380-like [Camelina sativa]|uniref:MATH domain and coiled-coil domain-containing protein At3g58380-like n=1 Tax=Camelina sativa TaxID=90675 RepID=A0ABM0TU42_CAMSA|nr:PREDICTED: MATH domain and coiled-coil domain-containing protein At3g58380-like [Camelina sativa]